MTSPTLTPDLAEALKTAFRRAGGIPLLARTPMGREAIIAIVLNEVAALSAPVNPAVHVPEEWRLVPVEATMSVIRAIDHAIFQDWPNAKKMAAGVYAAVLASAAPAAPSVGVGGWRDIASAPRDGTTFLAWLRGDPSNQPHIVNADWMGLARFRPNYPKGPPTLEYENWQRFPKIDPTHYMLLPPPPEGTT